MSHEYRGNLFHKTDSEISNLRQRRRKVTSVYSVIASVVTSMDFMQSIEHVVFCIFACGLN
jgi:hypothetical protein